MDTQLDFYFNTTNIQGEELRQCQIKAGTQNAVILAFFRANPGKSFTPFEVKYGLKWHLNFPPITSIRRAISTLTELDYLIMTDELRAGEYGAVNHCWRLNTERK